MTTFKQFVLRHNITMTSDWTDKNPNMDGPAADRMDHWRCVFKWQRRSITVVFSMGEAHQREPGADEVLQCLASDSLGVENSRGFEDWCGDYGYSTDSRKAERIYKTCLSQAKRLRQFCGGDVAFKELLDCEEA